MPEHNDPMTNTLDTLRSDVERIPLSDSLTVRRRGDRRTRNQAVGGALVVVALVAGAAGLYGGLGGDDEATRIPAVSPTPEPTVAVAADPLLRPSDFTELGRYASGGPLLASPEAPDLNPPAEACQVRPNAWGAQQTSAKDYYQDGSTVRILEVVLRYDTAEQAKAALDQPGTDLALCPEPDPADGTLEVRPAETMAGVGDGVHVARFFTPSAASEPSYYEVAAARTSNVVVVLTWAADDTPSGNPDSWAWSGEQLQTALDRAVM
jgi:hypothetical protein